MIARRVKSARRVRLERMAGALALAGVIAVAWLALREPPTQPPKTALAPESTATPGPAEASATAQPSSVEATAGAIADDAVPEDRAVIAWQPSHQNDTGSDWHEYVVCGDIVDRAIEVMPTFRHVKAWDTEHGLTGSNNYRPRPTNTRAFDTEVETANEAGADVFVSVHVDGGAPSGILGEYLPGDAASEELCRALVRSLCEATGLPDRGVREVRLYSLEAQRNRAPLRCLLEIGDNAADREFLLSDAGRDAAARGLAQGLSSALDD